VVALLVFSVSFALPARWAGRRWVGIVVPLVLFFGLIDAVLGPGILPPALMTAISFFLPFYALRVRHTFPNLFLFLPGFQVGSMLFEVMVISVAAIGPSALLAAFIGGVDLHSPNPGPISDIMLLWVILLDISICAGIFAGRILLWSFDSTSLYCFLLATSPVAALLCSRNYPTYLSSNKLLAISLIFFQCINLILAGRLSAEFLKPAKCAALLPKANEYSKSQHKLQGRLRRLLYELATPIILRLAPNRFAFSIISQVLILLETFLRLMPLGIVIFIHSFYVVPTAHIGIIAMQIGSALFLTGVLASFLSVGFASFILRSHVPLDGCLIRRSRRRNYQDSLRSVAASGIFSSLLFLSYLYLEPELRRGERMYPIYVYAQCFIMFYACSLWFLAARSCRSRTSYLDIVFDLLGPSLLMLCVTRPGSDYRIFRDIPASFSPELIALLLVFFAVLRMLVSQQSIRNADINY
jgi:hypothetical protein